MRRLTAVRPKRHSLIGQSINVQSKGGSLTRIRLSYGNISDASSISEVYNSPLGPLEKRMAVTADMIHARLQKDRRSVYVATREGESSPFALINVVRQQGRRVPRTHQELTDNEWFGHALENGADTWYCPWVAVRPDMLGYKNNNLLEGQNVSIGQMLVLAVKDDATEDRDISQLFAYSRPAGIADYLRNQKGVVSVHSEWTPESFRPRFLFGGKPVIMTAEGIKYEDGRQVFSMQDYWKAANPSNPLRKFDYVFQFHASLGAQFRPDLVRPFGQIHDILSLCFRIPLEYLLAT